MDTPTFKVNDKVRRKKEYQDGIVWPFGDTVCTVANVLGTSITLDDHPYCWSCSRFTLVSGVEAVPATNDIINQPSHYTYGAIEAIDYEMQVAKQYPGDQAMLVGNVIKYLSRAPLKGTKDKDLQKAQWYMNKLVSTL